MEIVLPRLPAVPPPPENARVQPVVARDGEDDPPVIRSRDLLDRRGHGVTTVDVSEIAKAEGAVTCCSLIFESQKT